MFNTKFNTGTEREKIKVIKGIEFGTNKEQTY